MKYVFSMQNASAGVNQACIAAYSAESQWVRGARGGRGGRGGLNSRGFAAYSRPPAP